MDNGEYLDNFSNAIIARASECTATENYIEHILIVTSKVAEDNIVKYAQDEPINYDSCFVSKMRSLTIE